MFGLSKLFNRTDANKVVVSIYGETDMGRCRPRNEDTFLFANLNKENEAVSNIFNVKDTGGLMLVADGMGGAAAGDIASKVAATTMLAALRELPTELEAQQRLYSATLLANQRICQYALENAGCKGMGTTLTAAYVVGNVAHIVQVGDSRAYLLRGGDIRQITKDQSLAQHLVDIGQIKPEQKHLVAQNVILQALGTANRVEPALSTIELYEDDCLLLCSDGLSNKVSDDEMNEVVSSETNLEKAVARLVALANERGGEDNITAVIARFNGKGLRQKGKATDTPTFETGLRAA